MKYRPEIDGLRALAVVPVLLFHAGFEKFSGGFVGVDVFFVISGHLITSIIIGAKRDGNFSLTNFYRRRARRILPALLLVMAVCVPPAWSWMPPSDLKIFCQQLVGATLFSSNLVLAARENDYFGLSADQNPLLHTWSLAVEEQFYLLYPIFLLTAWKFGKARTAQAMLIAALASLLLASWWVAIDRQLAFYVLPARAWELLIGANISLAYEGRARLEACE